MAGLRGNAGTCWSGCTPGSTLNPRLTRLPRCACRSAGSHGPGNSLGDSIRHTGTAGTLAASLAAAGLPATRLTRRLLAVRAGLSRRPRLAARCLLALCLAGLPLGT
ncbi:MAG: hypothetical protein AMJ59_00915 [Gammaproteobacteria bacterium SG8_31]|nr:MAG: hypothetical protein AMJ59_00915 [Gammaproteobacteria bacterium SG8_31]